MILPLLTYTYYGNTDFDYWISNGFQDWHYALFKSSYL